jgi:protein O-mannosyl-transferase
MRQKKVARKEVTVAKPQDKPSIGWKIALAAGIIVTVTFFSLYPALNDSFINWDDNAYVFENPHLGKPLSESIAYFFGPHYFIGNYIPTTMILYALEFHYNGLDTWFFHSVNLLLHLANVILVFWLIYLLSDKKIFVAAFVALFFGIHPMHVESVVWVAELKDVLYSFFFLAGLISYYKYLSGKMSVAGSNTADKSSTFFVLSFIFFILSVLSKPAAVVFPLVLLSLDFYAGRKYNKRTLIEKIPFFIVAVILGIVAIQAQKADHLIHDYYPVSQRLFFAAHSVLEYMVKLFLPIRLSIFYPYPRPVDGHLPYAFYAAPLLLIAICYLVYRTLKYTRVIAFGFLFFVVNIILVLQLLSVGDAIIADRYTYISYIGLFFIIAMGFDWLYHRKEQKLHLFRSLAMIAIIGCAILCSYLTYARCQVWENDDTVATDLLDKFPDDNLALNNKGFVLYNMRRYGESIELFNKAIQLRPDYHLAYINLINSYLALRDYENALKITDLAMKNAPPHQSILTTKGYLLFRQNKYAEALPFLKESLKLKKDNTKGYIIMGDCYQGLLDYNSAVKAYDTALTYEPDNYILLNNKGYALLAGGKPGKAIQYFKESLKIKPDFALAAANLSYCYRTLGDSSRAKN